MKGYTVKQLAKLAGISVRTLHHYDTIGLLKPSMRTEARYRLYGEKELLRLQQVLFYKELDFPLKEIVEILDKPDFDYMHALTEHKKALSKRKTRLTELLKTIDKTILKLKGEQKMITHEELYDGFPKAEEYREEAIETYGKKTVEHSENSLRKLSKSEIDNLKKEGDAITQSLVEVMDLDPTNDEVQQLVKKHYNHIVTMWGGAVPKKQQLNAYKGLATLYIEDKRFYKDAPEGFGEFLSKAMLHFVANQ
jgi:DNA-binding transcriptional MerR regulator